MIRAMKVYPLLIASLSLALAACGSTAKQPSLSFAEIKAHYALDPFSPERSRAYAQSLFKQEKYEQAAAVFEALVMHKDAQDLSAKDHLLMAQIYAKLEREDDQLKALETAVKKQPLSFHTTGSLIRFHRKKEDFEAAQAIFKPMLEDDAFLTRLSETDYAVLIDKAALNLVAMDAFQDAHTLALSAKERYPDNRSIERNNRIIRALLQSHGHNVPKPLQRPDQSQDQKADEKADEKNDKKSDDSPEIDS